MHTEYGVLREGMCGCGYASLSCVIGSYRGPACVWRFVSGMSSSPWRKLLRKFTSHAPADPAPSGEDENQGGKPAADNKTERQDPVRPHAHHHEERHGRLWVGQEVRQGSWGRVLPHPTAGKAADDVDSHRGHHHANGGWGENSPPQRPRKGRRKGRLGGMEPSLLGRQQRPERAGKSAPLGASVETWNGNPKRNLFPPPACIMQIS